MIRAVIIDDEEDAISAMTQFLSNFVTVPVKVSGTAKNLGDGIKIINSTKPDVVFLDINLPDQSGMEIYKFFEKPDFRIIFVTAYNQYAITALKNAALDYLLKPVDFLELRESISKLSEAIEEDQHLKELEDKASLIGTAEMEGQNILLEVNNGFVIENTRNIEYCYAEKAYSVIVTYIGKRIVVSKALKELQERLPSDQFLRTHKSYLVNINYIRKYIRASESLIILKSGTRIPVSARTSSRIVQTIKHMLET
jgi:two-component system, LytTR family, response regulator